MTPLQEQLLTIIQAHFPITPRPFVALARRLSRSEADVLAALADLQTAGIIRSIGPIFNAPRLGYAGALAAAAVPPDRLAAFVADVNALPGVSHNYGRTGHLNVWFTLTLPSPAALDQTLARLKKNHALPTLYHLPARRVFKIDARFPPDAPGEPSETPANHTTTPLLPVALAPRQIDLIRRLPDDLPLCPRPFDDLARAADWRLDDLLAQLNAWLADRVIRRFGARLRHQQLGFVANALLVFALPPDRLDPAGRRLARAPQVSHCYERPPQPDWPYNLYAMAHCRTLDELDDLAQRLARDLQPDLWQRLDTTVEYRKTPVRYFAENQP